MIENVMGGEGLKNKAEVKIDWEGKAVTVSLGKMTWGNKSDMLNYAIGKVKISGGETPEIDVDLAKFKEGLVMYSIKEAPFEVTVENLRKLDGEDFEKIFKEAMSLNPFSSLF